MLWVAPGPQRASPVPATPRCKAAIRMDGTLEVPPCLQAMSGLTQYDMEELIAASGNKCETEQAEDSRLVL